MVDCKNTIYKILRKLTHYLLGNYYFNVSNTGNYRNVLAGNTEAGNSALYRYEKDRTKEPSAQYYLNNQIGYNLKGLSSHYTSFYNLQEQAKHHYRKTINLSNDRELNARCRYLMAKCELNEFYNRVNGKHGYDGSVSGRADEFKSNFQILKTDYSDTEFYEMIVEECSFFKYYVSL